MIFPESNVLDQFALKRSENEEEKKKEEKEKKIIIKMFYLSLQSRFMFAEIQPEQNDDGASERRLMFFFNSGGSEIIITYHALNSIYTLSMSQMMIWHSFPLFIFSELNSDISDRPDPDNGHLFLTL